MGFPQSDHPAMKSFSWFLFEFELEHVVRTMHEMDILSYPMSELERFGVFDDPELSDD
jgi:hypothetical protein